MINSGVGIINKTLGSCIEQGFLRRVRSVMILFDYCGQ